MSAQAPFFRSPRTVTPPYGRVRVITQTEGDSMTDASLGNDTNINKIIERCRRDRTELPQSTEQMLYADVTNYQRDLEHTIAAGEAAKERLQEYQEAAERKKAAESRAQAAPAKPPEEPPEGE